MSAVRRPDAPGSALWASIAHARQVGWDTFSDAQYAMLLSRTAERFPDMELFTLRPFYEKAAILCFAWDTEGLLSAGIIEARDIPLGKKRVSRRSESLFTVKRIRGGRLEVFTRLVGKNSADTVALRVGHDHALAMFLPDAIRAIKGGGRLRPPYLRLVIDNTRKEVQS